MKLWRLLLKLSAATLFIDKRDPAVQYSSPGQGTVVAVNRGARRILETIVIRLEDSGVTDLSFDALADEEIRRLDRGSVTSRLHVSGLWTAFRTRPYSRVPLAESIPRSIFVTAIDTQPLAADPRVVIQPEATAFANGLLVVSRLTQGAVHLCTGSGWDISMREIERLQQVEGDGMAAALDRGAPDRVQHRRRQHHRQLERTHSALLLARRCVPVDRRRALW